MQGSIRQEGSPDTAAETVPMHKEKATQLRPSSVLRGEGRFFILTGALTAAPVTVNKQGEYRRKYSSL